MVKMLEISTGKELTFDKVTEAANFLGIALSSLYNKFKSGSESRGYKITTLELKKGGKTRTNGFKHFKYGDFKIDLYNKTAIIAWRRKVGDDFDEVYSYKSHYKAISDTLRNQMIFTSNFILLQEIAPKEYTQRPPETETLELYVQFDNKIKNTNEKKTLISKHLLPFL